MIKRTCLNKCVIRGNKCTLEELDKKFCLDFSMQSLLPAIPTDKEELNAIRVSLWGCEEDMDLVTHINCCFEPYQICSTYYTDVPNITFFLHLTDTYDIDVDLYYYDDELGYLGYNTISSGKSKEVFYSEDKNEYQEQKIEYGFDYLPIRNEKTTKIISMKNMMKRGE